MPEHVLMSEIEIITDGGRRRRWSAAEKLRIVEETLYDRASISVVARRNGVAPNLLYRWRRLMLDGGAVAVSEDDDVTRSSLRDGPSARWRTVSANSSASSAARRWNAQGCATAPSRHADEILREALVKSRSKKPTLLARSPRERAISGEGRGRHPGRGPLQPGRPAARQDEAASALSQGAGR